MDEETRRYAHDEDGETWVGVGGILYARRPMTSPPGLSARPQCKP
jgi:hypothetical protein